VHTETLRHYGLTELRPSQHVLVRFGPGPKGLMATEVRPEETPVGVRRIDDAATLCPDPGLVVRSRLTPELSRRH
jgi:hypothetical protein